MISFLDLFFNLLNLGILLWVLGLVVKNYLVPQLNEKIEREHTDFANLHKEHGRLMFEQESLEEEILVQEDRAKGLFKKINQWRNTVDIIAETERIAAKRIKHELEIKYAQRGQQYAVQKTYHDIAPLVVKKLEHDLEKQFADPQEGHAYIAQIVKKL